MAKELRKCAYIGCGRDFEVDETSRRKCCSDDCQKRREHQLRLARRGIPMVKRVCEECGDEFWCASTSVQRTCKRRACVTASRKRVRKELDAKRNWEKSQRYQLLPAPQKNADPDKERRTCPECGAEFVVSKDSGRELCWKKSCASQREAREMLAQYAAVDLPDDVDTWVPGDVVMLGQNTWRSSWMNPL